MNEAVTQDHFSKAIQEFQQGLLDEKALYQKFDELLADNHFTTQQALAEPKTRIVKTGPDSPAAKVKAHKPTSASQASSLLRHLMQWQEGDQQKEPPQRYLWVDNAEGLSYQIELYK